MDKNDNGSLVSVSLLRSPFWCLQRSISWLLCRKKLHLTTGILLVHHQVVVVFFPFFFFGGTSKSSTHELGTSQWQNANILGNRPLWFRSALGVHLQNQSCGFHYFRKLRTYHIRVKRRWDLFLYKVSPAEWFKKRMILDFKLEN